MYSASNDGKFWELFYHTIFNSMVALLEKTKKIMDKERKSQKDMNKDQTNIDENVVNQEKVDDIEKHNLIDTSK